MSHRYTRSVADLLQSTLQRLERNPEFRQDDPALIELKRQIVRAIAELEIAKSEPAASEDEAAEPDPDDEPALAREYYRLRT